MGLSKQDLDSALELQTKKLAKNLESMKTALSDQIKGLKDELDATKAILDDLTEGFETTKAAFDGLDEKFIRMNEEIESEVFARIRIVNQIYLGGATNESIVREAIALSHGSNVQTKSLKPVVGRSGENQGKTFGFIADFNNFNDKLEILRNSKKLSESENLKDVFVKSNQTEKQRKQEKALRESV